MATEVVRRPTVTVNVGSVSSMTMEAIEGGAAKLGMGGADTRAAVGRGDCSACETVRHELAKRLSEYLGAVDSTVKAVYVYQPEYGLAGDEPVYDRPNLSPGISLIVWTSRKSAALSSLIASLKLAVAEEGEKLGCRKANALCWTVDVQLVDDEEVRARTGYGALIESIYVRPVEIWHR